ncbi:T9SS type A sorting domain-containing protein [Prolixibacteraceae bacterium JC049]|nr:T9SS type A sorting domain-containing protein [Prolixibacteraceae bacterium JC049]
MHFSHNMVVLIKVNCKLNKNIEFQNIAKDDKTNLFSIFLKKSRSENQWDRGLKTISLTQKIALFNSLSIFMPYLNSKYRLNSDYYRKPTKLVTSKQFFEGTSRTARRNRCSFINRIKQKLMRKSIYVVFVLFFAFVMQSNAQLRVGDPGVTFDESKFDSNYPEIQEWITAGVEGGIPIISDEFKATLSATNSAEINAAINSVVAQGGGQIKLNNGTYTIDETVYMKSNVSLVGESRDGVILSIVKLTGTAITFSDTKKAGIYKVTMAGAYGEPNDFSMTDAKPEFMATTVGFPSSSKNCWLDKVSIINSGSRAFDIWRGSHHTFRDCHIERVWNKGAGGHGYIQFSGDHCLMYNCVVKKMRHIAIQREGCEYNVFYKNIVEQDFNFHNKDKGRNLVEQNTCLLPKGLGSGWHPVMGPWSYIHDDPGPRSAIYKNNFVENNNGGKRTFSDPNLVYIPARHENNNPFDTSDQVPSGGTFYPVNAHEPNVLELLNPVANSSYNSQATINVLPKVLGKFTSVALYMDNEQVATDNEWPYQYELTNLEEGTHTLKLIGDKADGSGAVESAEVTITIENPALTIVSPEQNANPASGETVTVETTVEGNYTNVKLLDNGIEKFSNDGTVTTYELADLHNGTHILQLVGTTVAGGTIKSDQVKLIVGSKTPMLHILNLPADTTFTVGCAYDLDIAYVGDFEKVSYYMNGSWTSTDHSAPYKFTFRQMSEKTDEVNVIGKPKGGGNWPGSQKCRITTVPLKITSPANDSKISDGSSIEFITNATGKYEKVSIYLDGSWKKTANNAPYNFTLENVPDGTHRVSLNAKTTNGKWVSSGEITIKIGESVNTSINKLEDNSIQIFPNPFQSELTIQNTSAYHTLKLLNISGKSVVVKTIDQSNIQLKVDGNLPAGIYLLQLIGDSKVSTHRIIHTH